MARPTTKETPTSQFINSRKKLTAPKPRQSAPDKEEKDRVTVLVDAAIVSKARDVVFWTPGMTVSLLVENALRSEIEKLEKKRGKTFPAREGDIKTGRPVSK